MVEFTVPLLLDIIRTAGILVGIVYYVTIMRNAQKTRELALQSQEQAVETRQAQLLMNLYEAYRSPTFRMHFDHVIYRLNYEDWGDFNSRFDPMEHADDRTIWFSVASFYNGMGVLLKRNLIDISLIDELIATGVRMAWEKIGPLELESRKRLNQPRAWEGFEYLYNELMRYHEEHPELKT